MVLYLVQIDKLFGPVQNNLICSKTISTDPKQFGRVQNGFEPTEGQGIRDTGVNKIESIKY